MRGFCSFLGLSLLLIKPQLALGLLIIIHPRRDILIILMGLLGASLLLWGAWGVHLLGATDQGNMQRVNVAPMRLIPAPLSLVIGVALLIYAYHKNDMALVLIGWIFCTPYLAYYSAILPYAALLVRFPRLAKIIFICTWVIYGGLIILWMI